jgi:tetratricopeptide (TPR) repeat protein
MGDTNRKDADNVASSEEVKKALNSLPEINCDDFSGDKEAYRSAIDSKNIATCACVRDLKFNKTCEETITDLNLYNQALNQANSDICKGIKNESKRGACETASVSRVEFLGKQDPQYLADIYASAHNLQAIEEYEALLQDNPSDVDNLIALSIMYSEKGLKEQEMGNERSAFVLKALEAADRAEKLDPNNPEVYRARGYAYEIEPDEVKSIDSYNKAIELE